MDKAISLLEQTITLVKATESEGLSVTTIADRMGYSRWQLQRTFAALVNRSFSDYLRDVKLSRAATRLLSDSDGLLDVALSAGFASQEAFSRAFKKRFGLTPGQYRNRGLHQDISLALVVPKHDKRSKVMNIRCETKPAMTLVGLTDYFYGHGLSKANNFEVIPKLWQRLNQEAQQQKTDISVWYGLISESERTGDDQLRYLAGYSESDGSMRLTESTHASIDERLYAIVPHHGLLQNLGHTLDAFFGQWLPESDFRMDGNQTLEVYDSRFDPNAEQSYFETWVPIVRHP